MSQFVEVDGESTKCTFCTVKKASPFSKVVKNAIGQETKGGLVSERSILLSDRTKPKHL